MTSETVHEQDKKQAGPDAVLCRIPEHGRLVCHGNGKVLVCGRCNYTAPVSA